MTHYTGPFVPSEVEGRVSTEFIPSGAGGGAEGLDTNGKGVRWEA